MISLSSTGRVATLARRSLPWPLPALSAWALGWTVFRALATSGAPAWLGLLAGSLLGAVLSLLARSRLRALVVAGGFPASLLASGLAAALPAWAWLLPLALLLLLYPHTAWRDAPLFPTPAGALDALAPALPLEPGARVLDAGCGLGHGLRALQRAYPQARLEGVEWSWPLALIARASCPRARVRRADLWACSWAGYDLVYLFQRPESMPRALDKARREMRRGTWLVSLEFEAAGWQPHSHLRCPDGRALWLYRLPPRRGGDNASSGAAAGR